MPCRPTLFALALTTLSACASAPLPTAEDQVADQVPAERQALAAGFEFVEPTPSENSCGDAPANTQDLRTACDDFGGATTSSEDSDHGYELHCAWADGSATLTLAPHAHHGSFEVTGSDCASSFAITVAAVSGPVF